MSTLARISELAPWLSILVIGALAFLVGRHFQREERKQRELRRQQTTRVVIGNVMGSMIVSNVGGQYRTVAQVDLGQNPPQGLGRLQDQPVQSKFKN